MKITKEHLERMTRKELLTLSIMALDVLVEQDERIDRMVDKYLNDLPDEPHDNG